MHDQITEAYELWKKECGIMSDSPALWQAFYGGYVAGSMPQPVTVTADNVSASSGVTVVQDKQAQSGGFEGYGEHSKEFEE